MADSETGRVAALILQLLLFRRTRSDHTALARKKARTAP